MQDRLHLTRRHGLIALAGACVTGARAEEALVKVCDDNNERPPFAYVVRDGGGIAGALSGYSVELLTLLFLRVRRSHHLELLPWKRCLADVREGRGYQMLINAAYTPERDRDYLLTVATHSTHPGLFWDRSRRKLPPPLTSLEQLSRYRLGGIRGYAYPYLSAAQRAAMQVTASYRGLLQMLRLGRIDFIIEDFEPIMSLDRIGLLDDAGKASLGFVRLPGVAPLNYHMMLGRQSGGAAELRDALDRALAEMMASGELARLREQYLPAVTEL